MYRSHKKFLSLVTILITTPMSKIDSGVYFSLYFPRERRFSRAFLRQLLEGPLPSFQPSSCSILPTTSAPGGRTFRPGKKRSLWNATQRDYSFQIMALRPRRGSTSLILLDYPSERQSGCGCCGCGCFFAPFLILLLFLLRCAEWFTRKLLTRI